MNRFHAAAIEVVLLVIGVGGFVLAAVGSVGL